MNLPDNIRQDLALRTLDELERRGLPASVPASEWAALGALFTDETLLTVRSACDHRVEVSITRVGRRQLEAWRRERS